MHHPVLPLVLAGLLGSILIHPAAVEADPYDDHDRLYSDGLDFGGHPPDRYVPHRHVGSLPRAGVAALPVYPYGYPIAERPLAYSSRPASRCNLGTVLTGAAIGGGLGVVLASDPRNRLWTLPMGAAAGGLLGGLLSGC